MRPGTRRVARSWLFIGALAASTAGAQDSNPGIAAALTSGQAHVNLTYRVEHVDQDNFADDAIASTLRVRLNYASGSWKGWSGFAEFDYIGELLLRDFNSGAGTSPDRTGYPVVADPEGADLNQLYLDYLLGDGTRLRFGRQRILLDNHRFVGNVGWRQNEQTYDGFTLSLKRLPKTALTYSYVAQVNRIFGERSPSGRDDENTHLLNARIQLPDGWALTPYAYYIDSDDTPEFSTATFGARLAGKIAAGDGSIELTGEFATQSDAANGPVGFRANYAHFDALWAFSNGLSLGIGFESLGGDENVAGAAFRTPLATLHAFQGWADQFLATPDAGIEDVYATVRYTFAQWKLQGTYHHLSAQSSGADWGTEIDLSAARSLGDRYGVLFKGAFFNANDSAFADVNKIWIMLTADF